MKTCSRKEEYINLDDENSLKYIPNYISLKYCVRQIGLCHVKEKQQKNLGIISFLSSNYI